MIQENQNGVLHMVRTGPRGNIPVIFVHPVGLDLTYWGHQIEALNNLYDLVAYDLPGNGNSPGTPADWTFDATTIMLARILDFVGADRAHIVGISIGGMIAQSFALTYPKLVHSLVLIGTASTFEEQERRTARERAANARRHGMAGIVQPTLERWFMDNTFVERPDIIDRVTKSMMADKPFIYAAMWDMIAEMDFVFRLNEITCPTLIMTGEKDPICPPSAARVIHDHIRGSKLVVIPDAAHMCILEQPSFINEQITKFLAEAINQTV